MEEMAYSGWLIKVGEYTIPLSLIKADTYSPYMSITDLDSYVDANGELHRNALDHVANKVEWECPAGWSDKQFADFMANIRSQYVVAKERKALVTLYIPELDDYVTQYMYMPDIKPNIYYADASRIQYDSIRFAFIGY